MFLCFSHFYVCTKKILSLMSVSTAHTHAIHKSKHWEAKPPFKSDRDKATASRTHSIFVHQSLPHFHIHMFQQQQNRHFHEIHLTNRYTYMFLLNVFLCIRQILCSMFSLIPLSHTFYSIVIIYKLQFCFHSSATHSFQFIIKQLLRSDTDTLTSIPFRFVAIHLRQFIGHIIYLHRNLIVFIISFVCKSSAFYSLRCHFVSFFVFSYGQFLISIFIFMELKSKDSKIWSTHTQLQNVSNSHTCMFLIVSFLSTSIQAIRTTNEMNKSIRNRISGSGLPYPVPAQMDQQW